MASLSLKSDISKAYDNIEYDYLHQVLTKMGFLGKWIELMMGCVSMYSYLILINGTLCSQIKPSRGLRQGDPLSSYLFLLYIKGVLALIVEKERVGLIKGISIYHGTNLVNHLLFADDSRVFCQVESECIQINEGFPSYECVFRQKLNLRVCFSRNIKK